MSENCSSFSDRTRIVCPKGGKSSSRIPHAIASPSGRLAQPQLGDQVLGGAGRDPEFFGDHAGRDDRAGQHIVEQRRQF